MRRGRGPDRPETERSSRPIRSAPVHARPNETRPPPPSTPRWKVRHEDFVVVELPLHPPTGRGPYQWLWVEKIGRSTPEVANMIARAARVDVADVAWAGLKDREARTEQAFTVYGGRQVRDLGEGVTLLRHDRTTHRLRVGELAGNRFRILVRGGNADLARARLPSSMPNFFGPQRVGGDAPDVGRNLLLGRAGRIEPTRLRFAIAAYQASLFNIVLRERGDSKLRGDLMEGGVATGPLYGSTMRWPRGEALALEQGVLNAENLPPFAFERFGPIARGARRALHVAIAAEITAADDGFLLTTDLPAGTYATVLLERICG